ncbi:MAG: UvrD-helicase domain-containing protein [Candidatus Saccharibacteria bacterium]|nr:UvrD-helicase domain-containing protein [Candidatus Saccharibacteria bacterium]
MSDNLEVSKILRGLNPMQKEAVEYLEGPLLILAGAGSGKTRTLTHRIANLILHGIKPERILAVTFTNKAAGEMRSRLWKLLQTETLDEEPPRSFMPYMGTFHGISVKILRIEAEAAGLSRDFVIYDADDQVALIKRILKNLKLNENKNLKPKGVLSIISNEKNQGNTPEVYAEKAYYPNQKQIAQIFLEYEKEKEKNHALDFDDLLLRTLKLFTTNKQIREKWQQKFEHILIDEYQDTNVVQYHLVKMLVNKKRNIAVVGDDWQSIYSWRGADFTNILNFEKDFPGAKVIKLEQNYRSTGNILEASQKIINNNKTRSEKVLFTESEKGAPVEMESLVDDKAEANYVALKILNLRRDYPDLSDFAVLYRTNAQSLAFEKVFMEMNLPYKIVGGVRFYDRKEIKDVLAILKLIVNGRDLISLERVMKNVLSGVGAVSIGKILMAVAIVDSDEPLFGIDFSTVLSSAKARASLEKLVGFLASVKVDNFENPGEIVKQLTEKFDFSTLVDDGTPNTDERMKNLEVLAGNASEYATIEEFVADAALMSSADEKTAKNAITLMTLHAAKGLEFPVVFIVGMEEGLFPSARGSETESELEEERRLMYVGMTRAKLRLFLTYARRRNNYGTYGFSMPSRFLNELGYGGGLGSSFEDGSDNVGSLGYGSGDFDLDNSDASSNDVELDADGNIIWW